MAYFDFIAPLRAQRTIQYGSLTMLALQPNYAQSFVFSRTDR